MKDRPFCPMPFSRLTLATTGELRPCCRTPSGEYSIPGKTTKEAFNSPKMNELRLRMINHNPPPECRRCFDPEYINGSITPADDYWNNLPGKMYEDIIKPTVNFETGEIGGL